MKRRGRAWECQQQKHWCCFYGTGQKGRKTKNIAKMACLYTLIMALFLVLLIFLSNKKSRDNLQLNTSTIYFTILYKYLCSIYPRLGPLFLSFPYIKHCFVYILSILSCSTKPENVCGTCVNVLLPTKTFFMYTVYYTTSFSLQSNLPTACNV